MQGETKPQVGFNWKNIGIVCAVFVAVFGGIVALSSLKLPKSSTENLDLTTQDTANKEVGDSMSELQIEDIEVGSGVEVKSGDTVSVHYKGSLTNGAQFDSSYDRGQPFSFTVGAGQVIQGWDQGLVGMKVGGKRRLSVPPELGYGAAGAGDDIPPNSTLVFEIELLGIN